MQKSNKEIFIGIGIGIVANLIGSYLYIYFFSKYSVDTTWDLIIKEDLLGSIIALGAILNLIAFFLLLKKNRVLRARGVLIATLGAAILVLISKFL
jgi:uncharacterized YccA/Bax inhibitor family protein